MADDDKKKPEKPIAKRDSSKEDKKAKAAAAKAAREFHKEEIAQNEKGVNRLSQKLELQNKSVDIQTKIDKLTMMGAVEQAATLQILLDETLKSYDSAPKNAANTNARLKEIADIQSQALALDENLQTESQSKLQDIIDANVEMNKITASDPQGIRRQLNSLESVFGGETNAATQELRKQLEENASGLEDAIASGDIAAQQYYRENLEMIGEGAESEEKRREALKLAEEQNSAVFQVADRMQIMGEKFDEAIGENARKAGFFAGLAGLALMFLDPEKFQELMNKAMVSISGIFQTMYAFITGDWDTFKEKFSENWKSIMAMLGGVALLFGGKIMGLVATVIKTARTFSIFMFGNLLPTLKNMFLSIMKSLGGALMKAIRGLVILGNVFRVFMMSTFVPSMIAAFSGMMAAMIPIIVAMAPILLPILAIAAAFGVISLALVKIRDALGFTSVFDVIQLGLAYLRDGFAHVGNFFINLAEGFVNSLGWLTPILEWLGVDAPDFASMEFKRLETGNAAAKKLEMEKKAAEAKEEEERKKLEQAQADTPTTIDGNEILNMSEQNQAGAGGDMNVVNAPTVNQTTSSNSVVQSTVIQSPITKATSVLASVTSR